MKVLLVHPSALLYSEVYLRLEPLGLECVGGALQRAGHDVRLLDLQVFNHRDFENELRAFRPDAVGFSLNYLANVPEAVDLAKLAKSILPKALGPIISTKFTVFPSRRSLLRIIPTRDGPCCTTRR